MMKEKKNSNPKANNQEDRTSQKKQSHRLVDMVEKLPVTLFHDQYQEPYARIG